MALMSVNRRENLRTEKPLVIQFRKANEPESTVWDMTLVRNISRGGAFFNSTYKINEGEDVEINLFNPHSEKVEKCVGTVVRSIDVKDHCIFYETAIKFKSFYEENMKSLNAFIDHALAMA